MNPKLWAPTLARFFVPLPTPLGIETLESGCGIRACGFYDFGICWAKVWWLRLSHGGDFIVEG